MDEALRLPGPDRFWESARAISGPDKEIQRRAGAARLAPEVTEEL